MFRAKIFEPTLAGVSYRIFIEALKSPVTKAAYSYALSKYMKYIKIENPDDLLSHRDNPQLIQNQIIDYMIYLKNPPLSLRYATRSQYLAAIMTFYDLNDVILNKKKIYRYLGEEERPIENRGYTIEEIAKMLEVCDERVRALLLFLASTGVRIRAIVDLKLEDLVNIPNNNDLYKVKVYATARERYFTFVTPEASKALKIYLNYRERCGEKLTPKSPLFRDQFDRSDSDSISNPQPIKLRALEWLISQTIQKSGLRTVERLTEIPNEHGKIRKNVRLTSGFRKFFDTQLIYADVKPAIKEMLMGHSIGLDDHYFKPSESEVLQEYLKAVNALTVNEENRLKIKVEELSNKNQNNEYIIQSKLQDKDKQIEALIKKQERFEILIQSLIDSGQLKPTTIVSNK